MTATAAPTDSEVESLVARFRDATAKTRGDVERLLSTSEADADGGEVFVAARIPRAMLGRTLVLIGQAPAVAGDLMSFEVKAIPAAAQSMFVDLATAPDGPLAIGLSDAPASEGVALCSVDAYGGAIRQAPAYLRRFFRTAFELGVPDAEAAPAHAHAHAAGHTEEYDVLAAPDPEAEVRARIGSIRRAIFDNGYSTTDVSSLLQISGEAVRQRLRRKELLGIKLNGDYRFPRWQFDLGLADGMVPELKNVLTSTNLNALELASWFETPQPDLGGVTPVDALRNPQLRAAVAPAAAAAGV